MRGGGALDRHASQTQTEHSCRTRGCRQFAPRMSRTGRDLSQYIHVISRPARRRRARGTIFCGFSVSVIGVLLLCQYSLKLIKLATIKGTDLYEDAASSIFEEVSDKNPIVLLKNTYANETRRSGSTTHITSPRFSHATVRRAVEIFWDSPDVEITSSRRNSSIAVSRRNSPIAIVTYSSD